MRMTYLVHILAGGLIMAVVRGVAFAVGLASLTSGFEALANGGTRNGMPAFPFFIGQAQVFPRPIRIRPRLALPVLAVLVTMSYWLWRVRIRRSLRGFVGVAGLVPR